jgi:Ca2+/Na+ antiporter
MTEDDKLAAYKTALETRNFEIQLFWQRSNYFLVLSTAIGTGFFVIDGRAYRILLGMFGIIVSWLWLLVNFGSKFWQSRWEKQLEIVERELPQFHGFFDQKGTQLREIVKESLDRDHKWWRYDRWSWYWAVEKRPSVSLMMTYLAFTFLVFWVATLIITAVR